MASPISQLKGTALEVAAKTYAQGLLIWNETAKRFHGGDGVTVGGIPMARYDERNDGALGYDQRIETDASNAVTIADLGKVIVGNRATAIAFNLDPATALTSKFAAVFKNVGAGPMTIVPNGTQLIDGVNAAITLTTGASLVLKGDGTSFRTYLSNADVTGAAINNASPLTGANLADADKLGVFDVSAAALVGMTIPEFVAGIFKTARKIANGYFLSSFRLWDTTDSTKGLAFNLAGVATATTRTITVPNADVDLGALSKETPDYESPEITLVASGSGTVAHSLAMKPRRVEAVLVCKTAGVGFAVGDEVHLKSWFYIDSGNNTRGVTIGSSSTLLFYEIGTVGPVIFFNRDSTAYSDVTLANWRLILRAWK